MARYWSAATAHNAMQRYREFAVAEGIAMPPANTKIMLSNQFGNGSAPMFAKRYWQTLHADWLSNFLISNYTLNGNIWQVIKMQTDVTAGYNDGNDQTITSPHLNETFYHEYTHASHYNKVGNNWWRDFVQAELAVIVGPGAHPYGDGNTANSPIIALGESWAYHMGHFMTNMHYGATSPQFSEQGIWYSSATQPFFQSNLNLLEDFSPARTADDPFWWIPQGLYYDLMDTRNDVAVPTPRVLLDDNVASYTNQQFFNALDIDINNLSAYRTRLLGENANRDAAGVNTIFTYYGY